MSLCDLPYSNQFYHSSATSVWNTVLIRITGRKTLHRETTEFTPLSLQLDVCTVGVRLTKVCWLNDPNLNNSHRDNAILGNIWHANPLVGVICRQQSWQKRNSQIFRHLLISDTETVQFMLILAIQSLPFHAPITLANKEGNGGQGFLESAGLLTINHWQISFIDAIYVRSVDLTVQTNLRQTQCRNL